MDLSVVKFRDIFKKSEPKTLFLVTGVVVGAISLGIISTFTSPLIVLMLCGGLVGIIIIYRNPFVGLILFVSLIPIEILSVTVSSSISVLRIVILGITFAWVLKLCSNGFKISFNKRVLWYLLFFIWASISLLWAYEPKAGFPWLIAYIQFAFLLVLIIDQVTSLARLKLVIYALAGGGLVEIIIFYLLGEYNFQNRMVLTLLKEGQSLAFYGYSLAYSLALLGVFIILGKGWVRLIGLIGFLAGFYPLLAMGLRGALLAVTIGVSAAIILTIGKKRSTIFLIILFLGLVLGAFNYLQDSGRLPDILLERFTVSSAIESDGSGRFTIWKIALELIPRNPVFGLGLNQFSSFVERENLYQYVGMHNDYLEALVSLGIVGAFFLITGDLITVLYLIKVRHHVQKRDLVWYGVLIALMIASVVGQNFVNQSLWKYIWVVRAMAIVGSSSNIWIAEKTSFQGTPKASR